MALSHDAAMQSVLGRYRTALVAYLTQVTGNPSDAEDLASEALIRVHRYAPEGLNVADERAARAYLFVVARRLAFDWRQKQLRNVVDCVPDVPADIEWDSVENPAEQVATQQLVSILNQAICELPHKRRQVCLLWMDDYDLTEIAAQLDGSRCTMKTHLRRALIKLRRIARAHGYGEIDDQH